MLLIVTSDDLSLCRYLLSANLAQHNSPESIYIVILLDRYNPLIFG